MKKAYVIGPYRAKTVEGIENNIRAAAEVAKELWKMGYAVFCPHLNSAHFDGVAPDESFINGDLEFLSCCDVMVILPGWRSSRGSLGEIEKGRELKLFETYWGNAEDMEWLKQFALKDIDREYFEKWQEYFHPYTCCNHIPMVAGPFDIYCPQCGRKQLMPRFDKEKQIAIEKHIQSTAAKVRAWLECR
jgi:hypothetical protein